MIAPLAYPNASRFLPLAPRASVKGTFLDGFLSVEPKVLGQQWQLLLIIKQDEIRRLTMANQDFRSL